MISAEKARKRQSECNWEHSEYLQERFQIEYTNLFSLIEGNIFYTTQEPFKREFEFWHEFNIAEGSVLYPEKIEEIEKAILNHIIRDYTKLGYQVHIDKRAGKWFISVSWDTHQAKWSDTEIMDELVNYFNN